jgi:hypothetical protein
VPLGHIQRGQRAWVGHKVLHLSSAPDRIQSHLAPVTVHGTQAPERVVQPVAVKNRAERQRLVISLRFAQMPQQLGPAVGARAVGADFVQGGVNHFSTPRQGRSWPALAKGFNSLASCMDVATGLQRIPFQ